jgi:hypothetical protein
VNFLSELATWAHDVADWEVTPDLWEFRAGQLFMAMLEQSTANTRFTREEQAAIDARIEQVRAQVRSLFDLTAAQFEIIDRKLDEMREASGRRRSRSLACISILITAAGWVAPRLTVMTPLNDLGRSCSLAFPTGVTANASRLTPPGHQHSLIRVPGNHQSPLGPGGSTSGRRP